MRETASYLTQRGANAVVPIEPVVRALFNHNLEAIRFTASMGVINNLTILAIVLAGAAVMRERERGTIEHLLVLPVRASEIAAAKIWANGLVILLAAGFSLHVVVHLALGGTYGRVSRVTSCRGGHLPFLRVFARHSAGDDCKLDAAVRPPVDSRFSSLCFLLSGSFTPFESMPAFLQNAMYVSPSTHFVRFAQAVLYRGAGIDVVWLDLAIMVALGAAFLAAALSRFRAMLARQS